MTSPLRAAAWAILLVCLLHGAAAVQQLAVNMQRHRTAQSLVASTHSSMFSAAEAQPARFKQVGGEFHEGFSNHNQTSDMLLRPQCKNFYRLGDQAPSATVVDRISQLFRPASEVAAWNASAPDARWLPSTRIRRMLTYEDISLPSDFRDWTPKDRWCELLAVRTPQRPVKVLTATSAANSGQTLAMPAIWKVASTSLAKMLGMAKKSGHLTKFAGPHAWKKVCEKSNVLEQCQKHTSFDASAAQANVKAAVVRNPLDRFLSSVYEHGEWSTCDGKICDKMVRDARRMARRLAWDFPHRWRSCAHPTQSYFLSATDIEGTPYKWDFILRLEDFTSGIDQLKRMGIELPLLNENSSGDRRLKKQYFDAVFSDLETVCSICKVYAQDFECLGYAMPDKCTQEECAKVGVQLA